MSDFPITLSVPSEIYERVRQLADENDQSVEEVLVKLLKTTLRSPSLPLSEQQELDALASLSEDALWTIAREQMSANKQNLMRRLMEGNNQGTLRPDEKATLETLVEDGHQLMLRKAQAAVILKERGFEISPDQLVNDDD